MPTPVLPVLSSAPFLGLAGVPWDFTKTPLWKTTVQKTLTGRRAAVPHYTYPLYRFQFIANLLRDRYTTARNVAKTAPFTEFDLLMGFFLRRYGAANPFFITDPTDRHVTNQTIIASAPASTTDYQLVRTITQAEGSFTEPVGGLNTMTELRVNGTPTVAFTGNTPHDGWIRFTSAPATGAVITADFSYYHKVCFESDTLDFHTSLVDRWEVRKLNMESWRP